MFGERAMMGQRTNSIDDKGRIFIPRFAGAITGEELALADENDSIIKIYSYNMLDIWTKSLNNSLIQEKNPEMAKKLFDQIESIYEAIIDVKKVDGQGRLLITPTILQRFGYENSIFIKGANGHLRLFKNEEEFRTMPREKIKSLF